MRAELTLEGAAELRDELRSLQRNFTGSYKPVLERIATRFRDSIADRMRAGVAPSLTETSIKLRGGGGTPLIGGTGPIGKHATGLGTMLGNLRAVAGEREASAVVDDFRARFHQFGFTTSEKSAIPGKVVPARPFVLISKADGDWALEELADFLFEDRLAA